MATDDELSKTIKKIIVICEERGFVTYDEINKLLPVNEYTSSQIDEAMATFSDMDLKIIEAESNTH